MSLPTATRSNLRKANAHQNGKLPRYSSAGDTPCAMNLKAIYTDPMMAKCLKLSDGSGAGLSVYKDSASSAGKSAILKFSSNLANSITIRNFDEDAAKGSQGYLGLKIDPKQAVLVKASDYPTEPNPFQPWDFDPNTFAAGADSAMYENNGKTFIVYLQEGAAKASQLVLNIAGAVGQGLKAILGDSVVAANGAVIELAEGQTTVSFSLVSDQDISADLAGSMTGRKRCSRSLDRSGHSGSQQKLLTTKCIAFGAANMPGRSRKCFKNRDQQIQQYLYAKSGCTRHGICAQRYYIDSNHNNFKSGAAACA
jgi:hypothetical protein